MASLEIGSQRLDRALARIAEAGTAGFAHADRVAGREDIAALRIDDLAV